MQGATAAPAAAEGSASPVSVARGAWVLLEALLSPDSGRDARASQAAATALGQAGSGNADFVVACFLQRAPAEFSLAAAATVQEEETTADCVRMLRVLEKVAPGVSASDVCKVGKCLQQLLVGMQCDSSLAAAAIAVKFALSKAAGAAAAAAGDASLPTKDRDSALGLDEAVCVDVVRWAGHLLACAHAVLYGGIWGVLPERADSLYPLDDADFLPAPAVRQALRVDRSSDLGLGPAARGATACALFIVGELAMLGFSVEEDEPKRAVAGDGGQPSEFRPAYSLSPAAKAFRLCIPAPLLALVQMLMGARLPHPDSLSSACELLRVRQCLCGHVYMQCLYAYMRLRPLPLARDTALDALPSIFPSDPRRRPCP